MNRKSNPPTVAPPFGAYCHAVSIPPNARWVVLAGQGGQTKEGETLSGIEAQADQAWRNILNILAADGMGAEDIVRVTTYLKDGKDAPGARAAKKKALGDTSQAGTQLVVADFALPGMLIEIDVWAAKA